MIGDPPDFIAAPGEARYRGKVPPSDILAAPQCHTIGFFDSDAQLCAEVAAFVAEGFALDQPALVVTNEPHRQGITEELRARGVDVEAVIGDGDLLLLDAEETLAAIMPGALPDADLYHGSVGSVVSQLLRGRPGPVRIFGDMVDLLWQRRQFDAAIRIEILSNQLALVQPISVICGYSMGHFLKTAQRLEAVTQLHGKVHKHRAVPARRTARGVHR